VDGEFDMKDWHTPTEEEAKVAYKIQSTIVIRLLIVWSFLLLPIPLLFIFTYPFDSENYIIVKYFWCFIDTVLTILWALLAMNTGFYIKKLKKLEYEVLIGEFESKRKEWGGKGQKRHRYYMTISYAQGQSIEVNVHANFYYGSEAYSKYIIIRVCSKSIPMTNRKWLYHIHANGNIKNSTFRDVLQKNYRCANVSL